MHHKIYVNFILPLRVYFSRDNKPASEEDEFTGYFGRILLGHGAPIVGVLAIQLDGGHYSLSKFSIGCVMFLGGLICYYFDLKVGGVIKKHDLTAEQIASRKLYLIGLAMALEPYFFRSYLLLVVFFSFS